ncbi:helix-turn-helix domain-containing protein [Cytobacillus spongiae]|uniref:helix-turn-helix domain-containing protein n=1 Tax=Bacillaceae TaxID=186817 RepID=UPI001F1A1CFF|nr:helix-turn-helix domain-containing protein [Cytobacillus spongiae]UII56240.1 helix-turn-helix domain-containing protein [Cytobacillus spongiae]
MKNPDIKEAIKKAGLKQWEVAEEYGLHEGNFSRLLRRELPKSEKQKIFHIINELKKHDEK